MTNQPPRRALLALAVASLLGCSGRNEATPRPAEATPSQPQEPKAPEATADGRDPHRVVFADRTSYAYLLLLPPAPALPPVPTREQLSELVKNQLADRLQEEEVSLLLEMIATDPDKQRELAGLDPEALGQDDAAMEALDKQRQRDVLGLYIDVLRLDENPDKPLIPPQALADPLLTRALTPDDRESLPERRGALLLRAEYRNAEGVRGLRLLQTLAPIAARKYNALLHDWDTGETMDVDSFERRRLRAGLGNVADQIAVVPFPDPSANAEDRVRLSTRGMRRFGAPELEIGGLPADLQLLQGATHLLYGLVYQVAQQSQVHPSGFAVEADPSIAVHYRDIERAYAGRGAQLPRCSDCPEQTSVHLKERAPHETDPRGHPVVRVVAPRAVSDDPGYRHADWVKQAVSDVLGD